ncbi:metallophosphoesterase [Halocella sp. SP3-1]|uniref:metallophosphoesterase n=1 Tax=Halocella sp. SP3-1 TaxID=2382161 RepID=UPI000F74E6C9|nr:metallophosphoesterase [Halocella sp. SP3-1]AZO95190.1 phosphohydrolase [Halocella sp. SP3-1]MTI61005.1 phosphohydrolase [Bacillota bacterium]
MKVYAIGDLHLSFAEKAEIGNLENAVVYKPMDIFGEKWNAHYQKIYDNWSKKVADDDLVLIPGDISWASDLSELEYDLDFLELLPGRKVLVRGNHDYWWQGITKLRGFMPDDISLIHNDSLVLANIAVTGTRGWIVPNNNNFSDHDEKIYRRELTRLGMALETIPASIERVIVMLHYMPVNEDHERNEIIELLQKYNVEQCVYGHLHGEESHRLALKGRKWGIDFLLVSSDYINFNPISII